MANLTYKQLTSVFLTLALTACGGGGGGDDSNPSPPPVTRSPQTIVYSSGDGVSANGKTELYVTGDDGLGREMISDELVHSDIATIESVAVSPDGQWVAYLSDKFAGANWGSLYVVPVDGSADPVRVSRQISNNGSTSNRPVKSFQWSPDSTRLVYAANQDGLSGSFFANEVYLVNRDGSGEVKINGSIGNPAIVQVVRPQWSPDGRFIIQEVSTFDGGTKTNSFALNIHDTNINGPNSRRLLTSPRPAANAVLKNVRWSPDSTRVSYMADQEVPGEYNVYVIDVVSGANVRVTDNGDFNSDSRWSPDGSTLAYLDHPSLPFPSDLIVSAATAGAADTVLAFLSPNGRSVRDYAWSPNGQHIAYTSNASASNTDELYVIRADGSGAPVKVNGALTSGGDVFEFAWSPDGNSIAYLADQTTDTFVHLYVSTADGSRNTAVSTALSGAEVVDFAWSDDNQRISFTTGEGGSGTPLADRLYTARPDGTGRIDLNNPMDVGPISFSYN